MKILYDLPIRVKFAVVLVPLVVIILFFDYFQIRHNFLDYQDSDRLSKTIILGTEINHVVHELQKERSVSAGFVSSHGAQFEEDLANQRELTDSTLNRFYTELEGSDMEGVFAIHAADITSLKNRFHTISDIRAQVDGMKMQPADILDYFSEINELALNMVDQLINDTRDKEIVQQVHALIYFLKAKERASVERAVGILTLSVGTVNEELYSAFNTLEAEQLAYLDAFLVIADESSRKSYTDLLAAKDVTEVDKLRTLIHKRDSSTIDPEYWYKVTTTKIDTLKRVEDVMAAALLEKTESVSSKAFSRFWTFIIVDIAIGVIAIWLMFIIVRNLLSNVKELELFTLQISKGDFHGKVNINTNDEIGQYGKTFNVMVDEIVKSHGILKKERDKAKFLYNNIYRVAMMVFQNIHQGIFLLDRNHRISKLYSKSMENIFGVAKISGENFANFMRPLIIPRDLEALEMFMRHLFNEEMDEEVVNQLNPIEQVKIFSDKDGVVTTKYIRVNFTRIWRKERIVSIMVTVSDETESVLLQKHLEEAEKKKKQETEQVLSILKIDPSLIRGFLHNAKRTLRGISERYESSKGEELKQLLEFTFQTVHNLKGNAVVIGLDIMSDKFHEVEESLEKLKDRDVTGKDFLNILYEIDDAEKIIDDMSTMLRKVADIYRKHPSGGHVVSNIMLIDTLERAVKVVSEKVGHSVDFFFKNDKNLVLPNEHIDAFRDIMIQLIRNSVVHGIEDSKERTESGKLMRGRISVEINQPEQGKLDVIYQDDGKGLDLDKIKAKAIKNTLITEAEAGKLSNEQAVNLIFQKGFSTSDEVNENAGRGQGMGLVKMLIEQLGGTFSIDFKTGKYFQMGISLPINANIQEEIEDNEAANS